MGNERGVVVLRDRENTNPPPPLMWLFLSVIGQLFPHTHCAKSDQREHLMANSSEHAQSPI